MDKTLVATSVEMKYEPLAWSKDIHKNVEYSFATCPLYHEELQFRVVPKGLRWEICDSDSGLVFGDSQESFYSEESAKAYCEFLNRSWFDYESDLLNKKIKGGD